MALIYENEDLGLTVEFDREGNIERATQIIDIGFNLEIDITRDLQKQQRVLRIYPKSALSVDQVRIAENFEEWFETARRNAAGSPDDFDKDTLPWRAAR